MLAWCTICVAEQVIPHNLRSLIMTVKLRAKRSILAIALAFAAILGGCNTIEGVGKDVEAAGTKTQEAAKKVGDKM